MHFILDNMFISNNFELILPFLRLLVEKPFISNNKNTVINNNIEKFCEIIKKKKG